MDEVRTMLVYVNLESVTSIRKLIMRGEREALNNFCIKDSEQKD